MTKPDIEILTQPKLLEPVNAGSDAQSIYYAFGSSQSNLPGFKYILEFNSYHRLSNATQSNLSKYKSVPVAGSGQAQYSPDDALKSVLGLYYTFSVTQSSIQPIMDDRALVKYKCTYGYEFKPTVNYVLQITQGTYNTQPVAVFTVASASEYTIGDQFYFDKTNKFINQYYDGLGYIVDISGNSLKTNIQYGITQSFTNETGNIKLVRRFTNSSKYRFAYNGTKQYTEREVDFSDIYLIDNPCNISLDPDYKFMTNYDPNEFKPIYEDQYETVGFMIAATHSITGYQVKTFDINRQLMNTYTFNTPIDGRIIRYELPLGTKNLSNASVSFAGVDHYTLDLINGIGTSYAKQTRQIVQSDCLYEIVRIMFLNRVGAYDYYNFKHPKVSANIKRTTYKPGLAWNYNIGDASEDVYATDYEKEYSIETDVITEYDYDYLEELFTSPKAFWIKDDQLHPIVFTSTSYKSKTNIDDNYCQANITFRLGYDTAIQGA